MRKPKVGADPGSYAFACPYTKRVNLVQVLSTFSLSMASSSAVSSKKVDSDVLGFLLQLDNLKAREESSTTLNCIRFCMDTDCETNAAEQPSMRRRDAHQLAVRKRDVSQRRLASLQRASAMIQNRTRMECLPTMFHWQHSEANYSPLHRAADGLYSIKEAGSIINNPVLQMDVPNPSRGETDDMVLAAQVLE